MLQKNNGVIRRMVCLNCQTEKKRNEEYTNIMKKILRTLPKEMIINELKRRKVLKFDWLSWKFKELKESEKDANN